MSNLHGKLTLTVAKAQKLHQSQLVPGWQSSFVVFNIGTIPHKTKVHYKGGLEPVWDCTQVFALDGLQTDLSLEVFHRGHIRNEFIGRAKIPVKDLTVQKEKQTWYPLVRGDKDKPQPAGEILLGVEWLPLVGQPSGATAPVQIAQTSHIRLPGKNITRVSIGSYYHLMALAKNGNFYTWNANTGNWHAQPGQAIAIAAASDGAMWVISPDHKLYRYRSDQGHWQYVNGPAGNVVIEKITVGSADHVALVSKDGNVYLLDGDSTGEKQESKEAQPHTEQKVDPNAQPTWKRLKTIDGVSEASFGADGELWVVLSGKTVSRFDPLNENWAEVPSPLLTHLGVGNGFQVVGCNADTSRMHKLDTTSGEWTEVKEFAATNCDVGVDGVYLACNADQVWFGRV